MPSSVKKYKSLFIFMLDIKILRERSLWAEQQLQKKDPLVSLDAILKLDQEVARQQLNIDDLRNQRNLLSKKIGEAKKSGADSRVLMEQVHQTSTRLPPLEEKYQALRTKLARLLAELPNFPDEDVLASMNPAENQVLSSPIPPPTFPFPPKNHMELNETLHLFDFETSAKLSGRGWPLYTGQGAILEWALLNYMLDFHIKQGFQLILPPHLVRSDVLYGSGQLPKFESQIFKLEDEDYPLYLIPTAEVPLMGMHCKETFQAQDLPKKYVSYTPCFRREAGSYGKEERGLIRMHQFHKVEMFAFTDPASSPDIFQEFVDNASKLVASLGLPFRATKLVSGDMSFAAAKTVDIEVWLPGQNRFYEVSSISNCTDFQARRSQTQFKKQSGGPAELVHTLNGSGLATPRLLVGLLENNQKEDGSVSIPPVLYPYTHGIKELQPL